MDSARRGFEVGVEAGPGTQLSRQSDTAFTIA